MNIDERKSAFIELGKSLNAFLQKNVNGDSFFRDFNDTIVTTTFENPWFTEESILLALEVIANDLSEENISKAFTDIKIKSDPKIKVGAILSGNKPIYGFLEMFCVLMTGNIFQAKNTANDNKLLELLGELLIKIESRFEGRIHFMESRLFDFQGVIANDFKINPQYLYKYLNKYPHIIHRRKYSAAIILENESDENLGKIAKDIFAYFGRTMYNVSKIFIPKSFNFERFFSLIEKFNYLINFSKYADQYEYNKSVFLLNKVEHFDNGFLLVKEDKDLASSPAILNFEYYDTMGDAISKLEKSFHILESVVCANLAHPLSVKPGMATKKGLSMKSRFVSTINFLSNLENIL